MQKTLTPEKLVLFVYDEISDPELLDEMKNAIRVDSELYGEYCEMQEARELLDASSRLPSKQTINNILNYSKALSVIHTRDHQTIELVLN